MLHLNHAVNNKTTTQLDDLILNGLRINQVHGEKFMNTSFLPLIIATVGPLHHLKIQSAMNLISCEEKWKTSTHASTTLINISENNAMNPEMPVPNNSNSFVEV